MGARVGQDLALILTDGWTRYDVPDSLIAH
jgi:hypothetical protein